MKQQEGRKGSLTLYALIALGVIVVLCVGYGLALRAEERGRAQERGVAAQQIGQRKRVTYQGQTWLEKTDMSSYLLLGIDKQTDAVSYGARRGGQSDFLMLVVIDHSAKRISQLQIDRDTMAQVETLGVLGNPIGTRSMQICLAHAFGKSAADNCGHTQRAVANLLEGIRIDNYLALNMNAIGVLNDALGGVTVTLADDYSSADPAMTEGATIQLSGKQAEILVRNRMTVGDGTNASRMRRQRVFITAAWDALRAMLEESPASIGDVFDTLAGDMTVSFTRGSLLNEANRAYAYSFQPVETLAGMHVIGEDGFMEFHVAEGATAAWVMRTYYEPLVQ